MKKILKAVLAVFMLASVTAAFFGVRACAVACGVQPALTWTFLAMLALTPLVGRLFCETMCPLGILQTLVSFVAHPKTRVRRVCTRLPETAARQVVRWSVFAAAFIASATGFSAIAWNLTPYAIYGKALALFAPGVVLAGAVLALALVGKGRIWCNWVCPVGTLFALLSKKSLLRHRVGPDCGNCRACFPKRGAGKGERATGNGEEGTGDGVTRRATLQGVALLAAAESFEKTTDGGLAEVSLPGVPTRSVRVLPPGAVSVEAFPLKCVGCQLCVRNCPGDCLKPSLSLKTFGQPELDFRTGFCLMACDYRCGKLCPAGAIVKPKDVARKDCHMGQAIWNRDVCIRMTEKVGCTACVLNCPVKAIRLVADVPVVDRNACIGCGACEHVCPARPEPAMTVEGYRSQRLVRKMSEGDLVAEMKALVASGLASSAVAKDGVIVAMAPGRDDPAICVAGKARKVYTELLSADVAELQRKNGIDALRKVTEQ